MKNFKLKRLFSLALIGGLSALSASTVFAAAGDTISNTASLSYSVGGVAQTAATGSVDFVEDNLVNFTVASDGNADATPNASGQMMTFTVTNIGNGAQDFALGAINTAIVADDFNVTSIDSIFVESGVTAGYQSGEDTAVYIDELAATASVKVYVFVTMPAAPLTGDTADITLTATVHDGSDAGTTSDATDIATIGTLTANVAGVDVILAEQDVLNDPAGATDAVKDGFVTANGTYVIVAANLSVAKTMVALWDPINLDSNPKSVPGALVRYTITVTNAPGGASADLTTLTDLLVAELALDLDFLDGAATPATTHGAGESFDVAHGGVSTRADIVSCTAAADATADGCLAAAQLITIDFATLMPAEGAYTAGELKPGESIAITFNAIVQ